MVITSGEPFRGTIFDLFKHDREAAPGCSSLNLAIVETREGEIYAVRLADRPIGGGIDPQEGDEILITPGRLDGIDVESTSDFVI